MVEMLVGCTVLVLLLVMLFSMTNQTTAVISRVSSKVDAFEGARTAFDIMSQRISQTTMNTYWDYYNSANQRLNPTMTSGSTAPAFFIPANYGRASDLDFVIQNNPNFGQAIYFAAPESLSGTGTVDQTRGLLNALGYYVAYVNDNSYGPTSVITTNRYRYKLMQCNQPSENFMIYAQSGTNWIPAVQSTAWPLANNVIALIVWPRQSLALDPSGTNISTDYQYDARNLPSPVVTGSFPIQYAQAPPGVQLTMVAIDEASSQRLIPSGAAGATQPAVISNALQASPFTSVIEYQTDLANLQTALSAAHVNYQVFTTTVSLRESKWNAK